MIFHHELGKGDPGFSLVFNTNHTSITHHLQYNEVVPLTRNEVKVSFPTRGLCKCIFSTELGRVVTRTSY